MRTIDNRIGELEQKYSHIHHNPFANMTDEELRAIAHQEPTLEELKTMSKGDLMILEGEFGEGYVKQRLEAGV